MLIFRIKLVPAKILPDTQQDQHEMGPELLLKTKLSIRRVTVNRLIPLPVTSLAGDHAGRGWAWWSPCWTWGSGSWAGRSGRSPGWRGRAPPTRAAAAAPASARARPPSTQCTSALKKRRQFSLTFWKNWENVSKWFSARIHKNRSRATSISVCVFVRDKELPYRTILVRSGRDLFGVRALLARIRFSLFSMYRPSYANTGATGRRGSPSDERRAKGRNGLKLSSGKQR